MHFLFSIQIISDMKPIYQLKFYFRTKNKRGSSKMNTFPIHLSYRNVSHITTNLSDQYKLETSFSFLKSCLLNFTYFHHHGFWYLKELKFKSAISYKAFFLLFQFSVCKGKFTWVNLFNYSYWISILTIHTI